MIVDMKIDKKIIKNILILLTLLMVGISVYEIANTYAVFYSELKGSATEQLAKWSIIVNGTDVSSGIEQEFTMTDFTIHESQNTKDGKIAPGMTGSFKIEIDPTDTQVSVRYDISIDKTNLNENKIELVSVKETNFNNNLIKTDENTYTAIIPLATLLAGNAKNQVEMVFAWENDEANNEKDTILGTTKDAKIQIPVRVKVNQYLGEEITEYIGTN